MAIILPKQPVKATRIGPKVAIFYSLPKVGKTEQLSKLPGCLTLDTEGGTDIYDMMKLSVNSVKDIEEVVAAIKEEGAKNLAAGKKGLDIFPYKFIALDTLDKAEELAEMRATVNYINGPLNSGSKFQSKGYKSVIELPEGGGYYYLREEMKRIITMLASVCPYLILIVHIKEKLMKDKDGADVKVNDISLTGKLSSIVCAMADCIGYLYRDKNELMVSFQTYDGAVMGARQKYLAGNKLKFSWETIYPDVFGEPVAEKAHLNGTTVKAVV